MAKDDTKLTHDSESLWYKDAIIYELHVRAFYDSDGDGIGDFRGLTEKLDYLQNLGVTAIWLLPFYPSPLRDDGYDIADYKNVNPNYGTLRDFKKFVQEAHKRGLKVITELVCNHTSDQHPWFQRARWAKAGSSERNFYVWSTSDEKYREARIIFTDSETSNWTWDSVAGAYYWHRFYHHQPDLNFENPRVQREVFKAMDFWLQIGVDGLRLDAVPYLYEQEGTNCENLPATHELLKKLREYVDSRFRDRMLLAEANQWPEDAVTYFGDGDECHMAFHFPLMPRLFMSIYMENRFPIIDILAQTPPIPETAQWALFLRNHDELTLEMVTDEERDYMYRIYAKDPQARINVGIRRRLAPLLQNNRRRIELMNGLLFSLPGTPVIYYGDEIGMGDNFYLGDRDAVRTPMQWSPDRNAGFSTANRQRLFLPIITDPEYHYEAINVASQQSNPSSMLWWMKRLIALRKRYKAFGRGTMHFLHPENRKVLTFIRRYEDEIIMVVANLSRFSQGVEIDLSEFRGMTPVEMFGRVPFPPIGELPYFVTLGPHAFFWFTIELQHPDDIGASDFDQPTELPVLITNGSPDTLFKPNEQHKLAGALQKMIQRYRWFRGKARSIRGIQITDTIPIHYERRTGDATMPVNAHIILLRIDYNEGVPETYLLPLTYATSERADHIREWSPQSLVATIRTRNGEGVLFDAVADPSFCDALLNAIGHRRRYEGQQGSITTSTTRFFRQMRGPLTEPLESRNVRTEQSNTSIIYGDQLILKIFRRVDEGINPDLEIGQFLTEKTDFQQISQVAGSIEYSRNRSTPMSLAILQQFVANEGDAWQYTLDALGGYFDYVATREEEVEVIPLPSVFLTDLLDEEIPPLASDFIGPPYVEAVRLLGQRTAEMHLALSSAPTNPSFAPEPLSPLDWRSTYQSLRTRASEAFLTLRKAAHRLPETAQEQARELIDQQDTLFAHLQSMLTHKITVMRTRCHGDYHLGQVLYTGTDFVIIDFEGEPARTLADRRLKRSPLRDVAGMLRSFQYAAATAMMRHAEETGVLYEQGHAILELWEQFWSVWVSVIFLKEYLRVAEGAPFIPHSREELAVLLEVYLFDKAIYEMDYELNNRPDWVHIPIRSILHMLATRR